MIDLPPPLAELAAGLGPALVMGWLLPYLRIQAALIVMPGWGERFVPRRIRVALAVALTPVMTDLSRGLPDWGGAWHPDLTPLIVAAGVAELAIGVVFGLFVRIAGYALGIAASAIASVTSLSQLLGGPSESAPHPIGNLLDMAGLALLMTFGYPLFLLHYMALSYQILPVLALPDAQMLGLAGVAAVSHAFGLAMVLASPFILGALLYQSLQGVVSRVMPTLPVVFIGAPAAIALALMGLALLAVPILSVWADSVLDLLPPELAP